MGGREGSSGAAAERTGSRITATGEGALIYTITYPFHIW